MDLQSGHQGLLDFLAANLDSTVTAQGLFAAGDRVVHVGRTRGTARATGRPFDAAEAHVWQVRDGGVVDLAAYVDTDELLRALAPS